MQAREASVSGVELGVSRRQEWDRIGLTSFSFYLILAVALIQGTFAFPAATLGVLLLVPLKKAVMRYLDLASKKADLLTELDSERLLEG